MMLFRWFFVVAITCLALTSSVLAGDALDAGRVRFTRAFRYAGETFEKGLYQVGFESGAEGTFIVLTREGKQVVRELAISTDAKGKARKKPTSSTVVVVRDGNRVRLTVREGAKVHLAFFEPAD